MARIAKPRSSGRLSHLLRRFWRSVLNRLDAYALRRPARRPAPRRSCRLAGLLPTPRVFSVPPLSAAEEAAVASAWRAGNAKEVLASCPAASLELRRSDLARLRGRGWLNDELVNFYLSGVAARFPDVHVYSSLFFARLCESAAGFDYAGVRRWTRQADVFSKRLLLLPINCGNAHWIAAAVRPAGRRIEIYDSLRLSPSKAAAVHHALMAYLRAEHSAKRGAPLPGGDWPLSVPVGGGGARLQRDGSACGVFCAAFVAALAAGAEAPFEGLTQERTGALRARIAADCLADSHTPLVLC